MSKGKDILNTRKDFKMFKHYIHKTVRTPKGQLVLIDVVHTPDCNWEGAYAIFNEEAFRDWWGDEPYTFGDVADYGEQAGAFFDWDVVSTNHSTATAAEKELRKFLTTI